MEKLQNLIVTFVKVMFKNFNVSYIKSCDLCNCQ